MLDLAAILFRWAMKVSILFAVVGVATAVSLAGNPAWSQNGTAQPVATEDGGDFVQQPQTLSVAEQLTELEMIVFARDYQGDPLLTRVSRLTHELLASQEASVAAMPLSEQVGRQWQAIQESPKYNAGSKQSVAPPTATNSGADSGPGSSPSIAAPPDSDQHPPFPKPTSRRGTSQSNSIPPSESQANGFQNNDSGTNGAQNMAFQQSIPKQQVQQQWQQPAQQQAQQPMQQQFQQPAQQQVQQPYSDINLNRRILAFAAQNFGKQVGDGECWSLAAAALNASGACPAEGYTFGRELRQGEEWWPGDIIQFTRCRFKINYPGGRHTIITCGSPNHTAIFGGMQNGLVMIDQQNHNGIKTGAVMCLDMRTLVSGSYKVFRPLVLPQAAAMQSQSMQQ